MTLPSVTNNKLHPNYPICGIDMSVWQVWSDVKKTLAKGVDFVIIRAGYGLMVDKRLVEHRNIAERNNIPAAYYWYWLPQPTAKDMVAKMRSVLHADDIIFIDLEKNGVDNWPAGMTVHTVTDSVLAFLEEVERQFMGREPGIYSSAGWWNAWIDKARVTQFQLYRRTKWLAHWYYSFTKSPYPMPYGWNEANMWQFSGSAGPYQGKAYEFGITYSSSIDVNAWMGSLYEFNKAFNIQTTIGGPR